MSRNKAASGWMFGAVITLLALFASLLGLLTAVLPPWAIVAVLSLPLFFALASRFPECGLLFVLLLLTGLVPSYLLPHLPLLGGQVNASDLFLAVLFPLALVQGRRDLVAALSSQTAVVLLLAVVFLSLLISMAIAFGYAGNDRKAILAESRILM